MGSMSLSLYIYIYIYILISTYPDVHVTQAALRMTVRTRRDSSARLLEFVLRGVTNFDCEGCLVDPSLQGRQPLGRRRLGCQT